MQLTTNNGPRDDQLVAVRLPAAYHGAVVEFKRRLIEATLRQVRGNRTHAARALGLQRTYLLRLIRELGVVAPPPPPRRRTASASSS
jgi:DNA-binding NtrC family response regulator